MKIVSDFTLVGELPEPGPWTLALYCGAVVALSPNHPPHMRFGNCLKPVDFGGLTTLQIMDKLMSTDAQNERHLSDDTTDSERLEIFRTVRDGLAALSANKERQTKL